MKRILLMILLILVLLTAVPGAGLAESREDYYYRYKNISDRKDWSAGEKIFSSALEEYPDEIGFHTILNRLLREQKKPLEALARIEPLYRKHPKNTEVLDSYKFSLMDAGWHLAEKGEKERALSLFREAYGIDAGNEWIINGYGYILKERDKLEESISVLERGWGKYPKNEYIRGNLVAACLARAMKLKDDGDMSAAEAVYARTLKIDPANEWALLHYGIFLSAKEDHPMALNVLRKGLALYPANRHFHPNLAATYYQYERGEAKKGDFDRAIALSREAVEQFPGEPWFLTDLSDYFLKKGNYARSARYAVLAGTFPGRKRVEKESGHSLEILMYFRMREIVFRLSGAGDFNTGFALLALEQKAFPFAWYTYDLRGQLAYHSGDRMDGLKLVTMAYDLYIARHTEYRNPVAADPPLKGTVLAWGNSRWDAITHAGMDQFCFDFTGCSRDGRTRVRESEGPGENEDYIGFGMPLYATTDGTVERVVDDRPDLKPAKDYRLVEGNLIVLRDAPGRHHVFVHNRRGSAKVREGDAVRAGQVIGAMGNSGMTTFPHLHFGVYSPDWTVSLPVVFRDYKLLGKSGSRTAVKRGTPKTGEVIEWR